MFTNIDSKIYVCYDSFIDLVGLELLPILSQFYFFSFLTEKDQKYKLRDF